jgi:phosphoribosylamine--glycine ligase
MNILLLGSGGREHTLAWKMAQSPLCTHLFIAPGNAGTSDCGENVNLNPNDFEGVAAFCEEKNIELLVCGPEEPLVKGLRDFLENIPSLNKMGIIGPGSLGATLEGSKDFSKAFMLRHRIPTAASRTFTPENYEEGRDYLKSHSLPIVLKADGLAAGKGVLICESLEEALTGFEEMLLKGQFGDAGKKVVVEQFLKGIELSVFVLTDGENYVVLPEAKDYKRIGDHDTGLNTGGMGSVSPVPFADKAFMQKVKEQVIIPTVDGLKKDQIPYKGFIFIGLMNVEGDPFVIEYNVRMGDPETQSVVPRIQNDLVELFNACAHSQLAGVEVEFKPLSTATVVMVAGGYPGNYRKGSVILGLSNRTQAMVFHAGTLKKDNKIVTNGGRVLGICGMAGSIPEALQIAYEGANSIHWEDVYFRRDIGKDLMNL